MGRPAGTYITSMPRPYPFAITLDGRRYTGDWQLIQGGQVCVRSAYGSDVGDVGRAKPETVAALVLERIVRADLKRRAEHAAHQAREMEKLRKPRKPPRARREQHDGSA